MFLVSMPVKTLPDDHLPEFVRIVGDAYPAMDINTPVERDKAVERFRAQNRDERNHMFGCYRDDRLVGGIRLHDFQLHLRGALMACGGGGMLAVDLPYKKQHVAKEIMQFFFGKYRQQEASMAALWPFRPDFYRKMGVGYGGKISEYHIDPSSFPLIDPPPTVKRLTIDNCEAVVDCFNEYAMMVNGMILESVPGRRIRMEQTQSLRMVGFEQDGKLRGYIQYAFRKDKTGNFLVNDLIVQEFVYLTREALLALCSFLRVQADQVNRVVIRTHEDDLHHLLFDPRNASGHLIPPVYHEIHTTGIGIMYRVLDVNRLWAQLSDAKFNDESLTVTFQVRDTFMPENDGPITVVFDHGKPSLDSQIAADVTVGLDVCDLASLIVGSADLSSLVRYGRVTVDNSECIRPLTRLFLTDHQPLCLTPF